MRWQRRRLTPALPPCDGAALQLELPPVPPGTRRLAPLSWDAPSFAESVHGRHYNTRGEVEMHHRHEPTTGRRVGSLLGAVAIDHYGFPRDPGATADDFPPGGKGQVSSMSARIRADAVGRILKHGEGGALFWTPRGKLGALSTFLRRLFGFLGGLRAPYRQNGPCGLSAAVVREHWGAV